MHLIYMVLAPKNFEKLIQNILQNGFKANHKLYTFNRLRRDQADIVCETLRSFILMLLLYILVGL